MSDCQTHEEHLSAWLDRELEPREVVAALEHALLCESCRAFFAAARRLEARPMSVASAVAPAPPELWERIRERAPFAGAPRFSPPRLLWLARAAMLVVGLALGWALAHGGPNVPRTEANVAGAMDQDRFVALTRELLSSEPRFQRTMYQVLRDAPALVSAGVPEDDPDVRWLEPAPNTEGGGEAAAPRPRL